MQERDLAQAALAERHPMERFDSLLLLLRLGGRGGDLLGPEGSLLRRQVGHGRRGHACGVVQSVDDDLVHQAFAQLCSQLEVRVPDERVPPLVAWLQGLLGPLASLIGGQVVRRRPAEVVLPLVRVHRAVVPACGSRRLLVVVTLVWIIGVVNDQPRTRHLLSAAEVTGVLLLRPRSSGGLRASGDLRERASSLRQHQLHLLDPQQAGVELAAVGL
mmetsp:Transcript_78659/g.206455  ORF Transcript_78659/g.206455 Transcript_78659/m.206455 type:complete len:216 (-) Transcript_78659:310-957(-)